MALSVARRPLGQFSNSFLRRKVTRAQNKKGQAKNGGLRTASGRFEFINERGTRKEEEEKKIGITPAQKRINK